MIANNRFEADAVRQRRVSCYLVARAAQPGR